MLVLYFEHGKVNQIHINTVIVGALAQRCSGILVEHILCASTTTADLPHFFNRCYQMITSVSTVFWSCNGTFLENYLKGPRKYVLNLLSREIRCVVVKSVRNLVAPFSS